MPVTTWPRLVTIEFCPEGDECRWPCQSRHECSAWAECQRCGPYDCTEYHPGRHLHQMQPPASFFWKLVRRVAEEFRESVGKLTTWARDRSSACSGQSDLGASVARMLIDLQAADVSSAFLSGDERIVPGEADSGETEPAGDFGFEELHPLHRGGKGPADHGARHPQDLRLAAGCARRAPSLRDADPSAQQDRRRSNP